jgi:hypothetical protein
MALPCIVTQKLNRHTSLSFYYSLSLFFIIRISSRKTTMDLGFGKENQTVGEAVNRVLLESSKAQEAAIDSELQRFDALLLEDEDALEQLRRRRLQQLKSQQKQRLEWKANGHGTYVELNESTQTSDDVAKTFFDITKQSERVVVHFHRPSTRTCQVVHAHLEKLASLHLETKFCKINVEACEEGINGASFLVQKLGIVVLPTLVLIQNRKVVHHLHGFDELGGTEDFSTNTLAYVLGAHGVLNARDDEVPPPQDVRMAKGSSSVNAIRIHHKANSSSTSSASKNIRSSEYNGEYQDDD